MERDIQTIRQILNDNHAEPHEVERVRIIAERLLKECNRRKQVFAREENHLQERAAQFLNRIGETCSLDEVDLSKHPESVQREAREILNLLNQY